MTEVILFNPPVYFKKGYPISLDVSFPPLGLLYLASVLEKNNICVKFYDIGVSKLTLKDILAILKKKKPKIVGITSMTPTLQGALSLAKEIKRKYKNDIKICLGGPHVSADPDFIKRNRYFDFAIQGEAEVTFLKLVKEVLFGNNVSGVFVGIPEHNLDNIPWPARHLVNSSEYLKKASLLATRGCPFNCYYCSRPAVSNYVRCRAPKDIVDEMESLYSNCQGEYLFQDDSLTINRNHTEALCHELITRQKKFHWAGYTRVDLVDKKLLSLMAKAGCYSLTFGIESGDEKLRNTIVKKKFSNQNISEVIDYCRQFHIDPDGFFMFGHPTETKDQVIKTINFILRHNFNIVGVSIATPFPGSDLWQHALKEHIVNHRFIDSFANGKLGEGYAGVYPVYHPQTPSLDWLYQQRRFVMRHFYLRPKYILKRLSFDIFSLEKIKRDFVEAYHLITKGSSARAPYKKTPKYL